jgi:rhomboid protease GluP
LDAGPIRVLDLWRGRVARAPVTLALVAANAGVFALLLAHGAGLWHTPGGVQLAWGANFGPATKDGEWWRLGTALFMHFGLLHLAMNLWALWDAGRLVEALYGRLRLGALYFASGLAGNLLSLVLQGDGAVSGGASGAIFGLYGALLVCLWRERRLIPPTEFRWLFGGAAVFAAATIGFGFVVAGIDNAAHAGGLASGALLGIALARPLAAASPRRDAPRWIAAGAFSAAVIALAAAVPAPSYRWRDELQARSEVREFLSEDRRILERWREILESGSQGATFEELAARIELDVAREYRESFEQLSALHLDPGAPSAAMLEIVKRYARLRGEASHLLAEGLRLKDERLIREALERAQRAPYEAGSRQETPP